MRHIILLVSLFTCFGCDTDIDSLNDAMEQYERTIAQIDSIESSIQKELEKGKNNNRVRAYYAQHKKDHETITTLRHSCDILLHHTRNPSNELNTRNVRLFIQRVDCLDSRLEDFKKLHKSIEILNELD